ncbi:MAG: hypothetical protein ACOYM3_17705 [Terrimicrobiaceae bacterium]
MPEVWINADRPSTTEVNVKTTEGVPVQYRLISLPSSLAGQLPWLLDQT